MSLMNALLKTYNYALDRGLVDNPNLSPMGLTILPIYHSSRKVASNEDVFELTLDKESNAIHGRFLSKDEIIVFPITEGSITRAGSKIAPHAISDELSYLSGTINSDKNKAYLEEIQSLLDYEKEYPCENFKIIGKYILENNILEDFIKTYLGKAEYEIDDKHKLKYKINDKGKELEKQVSLDKIFITFKIEKEDDADITLTRDISLHNFYINYIEFKNSQSKKLYYCDITGELSYCVERHRGIIGNAKLISISNNDETYYGRLKKGGEIYHVSYRASQKAHNMLKYLLDNKSHSKYIGEDAYVVNWLSTDLNKGGIGLLSEIQEDDDFALEDEVSMQDLGGNSSENIGKYFYGEGDLFPSKGMFYVLIIEKISNGRISVKYFRELSKSEGHQRIMSWYESTNWDFYKIKRSPSVFEIVNFLYGEENKQGFLSCENKKLFRNSVERLIPCIIDSQKIARDIVRTAFYRLSNKHSYKKRWNTALSIGCALVKKYKYDYENYIININNIGEAKKMEGSRSFYYGRLLAIYEKIELDATRSRVDSSSGKDTPQRVTNSDRLWNSFIRAPERTRLVLETKIRPYINILKKSRPGSFVNYDKLITEITKKIISIQELQDSERGSLNEDFIIGYYYQKDELYKQKNQKNKL